MTTKHLKAKHSFLKLLEYSRRLEWFAFLITAPGQFEVAIGKRRALVLHETSGAFDRIEDFWSEAESALAGYFGYDLKNDLERLVSENPDVLQMPEACLFEPVVWVRAAGDDLHLEGDWKAVADLIRFLEDGPEFHFHPPTPVDVACSVSRESYMENAGQLLNAIARGDIYEVNYCVPFFGNAPDFDPQSRFHALQSLTEAPFSVFARMADRHILCASPERFLKNKGGRLTSQPIKGTIRRSPDADEDNRLRGQLFNDEKERAENVMIVDLVRNDLSRVAARSSVRVRELFGVYTFKTVHHLVSTIEADLDEKSRPLDAIRAGFPPGSMTGAPKISAMERIEKHENFKRGCYAGSFGKLEANGDFDLNVVIRTIIHHPGKETVGFAVGGALTAGTHPDREYRECLLKAEALIKVLHGTDGH